MFFYGSKIKYNFLITQKMTVLSPALLELHFFIICSLSVTGKNNSMCIEVFDFLTIFGKIYTWKTKYNKVNTSTWWLF